MLPKRKNAKQYDQHNLVGRKFWHTSLNSLIYTICKHKTDDKQLTVTWKDEKASIEYTKYADYNIEEAEGYVADHTWKLISEL